MPWNICPWIGQEKNKAFLELDPPYSFTGTLTFSIRDRVFELHRGNIKRRMKCSYWQSVQLCVKKTHYINIALMAEHRWTKHLWGQISIWMLLIKRHVDIIWSKFCSLVPMSRHLQCSFCSNKRLWPISPDKTMNDV